MEEIFIDIRQQNEWIRKYYEKDLIKLDELFGLIEDLDYEIDILRERIDDLNKSKEEKDDEYSWRLADEINDERRINNDR